VRSDTPRRFDFKGHLGGWAGSQPHSALLRPANQRRFNTSETHLDSKDSGRSFDVGGPDSVGQYRPRPDSSYQVQDQREAQDHGRLFDRVRADLDRAHGGTLPSTADRSRVNIAQDAISRCQRSVAVGEYDQRQFEDSITAIQRVTDLNRLSDQSRNNLLDDMHDLRRLQESLDQ